MSIDELLKIEPFSLNRTEKEDLFSSFLSSLSLHHYENCEPYKRILNSIDFNAEVKSSYTEIPFIPVQLFKSVELISTKGPLKTLSSSGTSGEGKTKVYLDKENALNQTKVLAKIVSSFIGAKRLPMMIIDSPGNLQSRSDLSARAAGITGFSLLGSRPVHVLNEKMELNTEIFENFMKEHGGKRVLLFGFTYIVFQNFYKELVKHNLRPDLSNAILVHGGGWKKMEKESVSMPDFKSKLKEVCGIETIHNYYGMAEQTGSIFMECEYGHLHASVFSDVIIRRAIDFSEAGIGEEGIIQVLSLLPKSYPGHSLLTDDSGILLGEDNCKCGRLGKYFKITGRLKHAEPKGCSDIHE